jgi:hypothetical protein
MTGGQLLLSNCTIYNSSYKLPAALHGVLVRKDFKYSVNLKTNVPQGIKEQEQ